MNRKRLHRRLVCAAVALVVAACTRGVAPTLPAFESATAAGVHGPIVIRHQHHRVYRNLYVASSSGDCVEVIDSSDITIEASELGPCGGNGINVESSSAIRIYDSYIHPQTLSKGCCDHNDGVLFQNVSGAKVQGNVIAYGESNVEAPRKTHDVWVVGNFLLNPRGPYPRGQNVQAWIAHDVIVRDNYTLSSPNTRRYLYPDDQEDSINFGLGSNFVAQGNYVTGGHSRSGCGLLADDGANDVSLIGNRVVDSGQCGIGIASGTDQDVERNQVINLNPVRGAGNTAVYVWKQYEGVGCGPATVAGNVATEVRKDGTQSGFWNGGGCNPVRLAHNVWGRPAEKLLTPIEEKLPPPPIPPEPKSCVIASPYSTQTHWPACRS